MIQRGRMRRELFGVLVGATCCASALQARVTPARAPWARVVTSYNTATSQHYLAAAAVSQASLRGGSDLVGQVLRGVSELNLEHAAAMATVGFLFSGLCGATWLRQLERTVGGKAGERESD